MSGLGGQEAGRLITVQTDLPGNIDGILERIREILMMGRVQTLRLALGEPLTYQRMVLPGEERLPSEDPQGFAELDILDVVRNVEMEEFNESYASVLAGNAETPHQLLVQMFLYMNVKGLEVTHLVVPVNTEFWMWIKSPMALERFLGARVEITRSLNKDVFLICGARSKVATIAEIVFVLKGSTHGFEKKIAGGPDEGANQEGHASRARH